MTMELQFFAADPTHKLSMSYLRRSETANREKFSLRKYGTVSDLHFVTALLLLTLDVLRNDTKMKKVNVYVYRPRLS